MKKAIIQLKFDEEKLTALGKYMQKKGMSLESELQDTIQKLYERYVPPAVREYIESREPRDGKVPGEVRNQDKPGCIRDAGDCVNSGADAQKG